MTHKLYELKNPLRGTSIYDAGTSYSGTAGLSEPGSEGAIALPPNFFLADKFTLFGTGGDTFINLSFLDQILSAEFFSKISKLFWR